VSVPALRFKGFTENWYKATLKEIYPQIRNGFVGIATPFYAEKGIKYLQGKNIKNGAINSTGLIYISSDFHNKYKKSQLRLNDIVMVQSGHVGNCAVISEDYVNSNCHALVVLTPKNPELTSSSFFVFYFNSSYGKRLIYQIKTGNTIEHILASDVKELSPFAPSFNEQQKIASFLSAVDKKIELLAKKHELLEKYKKGLMQKIFSQEIRFKQDDGSDFPDWETFKITDIAKTSIGLVTSMTPFYVDNGIPLIRNNDIFQNKVRTDKLIQLCKNFDEKHKLKRLSRDDIVTVHTGDIGVSALIDKELDGAQGFATLNTRIINIDKVKPSFVCWYFNSKQNIKYALSMATGDGRSNYNLKDFNNTKVPTPTFKEQNKIASFLSSVDNKIELAKQQIEKTQTFKKGLLQQMFV